MIYIKRKYINIYVTIQFFSKKYWNVVGNKILHRRIIVKLKFYLRQDFIIFDKISQRQIKEYVVIC
jgi:hypothetical protein